MPTALITGSTGGLGQEFARIHVKRGGDLILVGRNEQKLAAQATQLEKDFQVKVAYCVSDLSQEGAAQEIYDFCQEHQLIPDYFINNAGFGVQGDFARQRNLADDTAMITVNITAPTQLLKLFLPDMIARGHGKVLNVSSIASLTPGPLQAVYFASKAYITSWSEALAKELEDTGVTVTCLLPAALNTGFISAGNLEGTALFKNAPGPAEAAQSGYEAMLEGKLRVYGAIPWWQKPWMRLLPVAPRKPLLNLVYKLQQR